jgi:hypothetical protein
MLTLTALIILLAKSDPAKWGLVKWNLHLIPPAMAAPSKEPILSTRDRSFVRYHLRNLWSEMDLLVRNRQADERDLRRQDREFTLFKVFDRIPFEPRTAELKKELSDSAGKFRLAVKKIEIEREEDHPPAPPKTVYTDKLPFHFSKKQLCETLHVTIEGKGSLANVKKWIQEWDDVLLRFVEPLSKPIRTKQGWRIKAATYRFRDVAFPKLNPRDPMSLLPGWAQQNPEAFAQKEPELWSYVTRIRARKQDAEILYENRRKFLLNAARMSFFLSKALPSP